LDDALSLIKRKAELRRDLRFEIARGEADVKAGRVIDGDTVFQEIRLKSEARRASKQ
jgi:hypothetical protein